VTSIKLSIPKPTSEILPAIAPAMTATNPSKVFHPMVKYSSLCPRTTAAERSKVSIVAIPTVYTSVDATKFLEESPRKAICLVGRVSLEQSPLRDMSGQGLQEVFDEIVGMFKAHGQTKHIARRVGDLPLTRCAVFDQTLGAAKTGGIDK
jgi:hypothetical protein